MKYCLVLLCAIVLIGCGTTSSLREEKLVLYTRVFVNDNLIVTGRLIDIDSTSLKIAVSGTLVQYDKNKIKGFELLKKADENLVNEDILINTSRTTSALGFIVFTTLLSLIAAISAI